MTRAKRALDVVGAAASLCALAPLMAWIAWRVRREDGGPVLFRQQRVGAGARPFEMLKFRTMRVGAERQGAMVTAAGDPRVTHVGAWLRRTKLDELPQLWNVLRGDMSLVGPRPEVPCFVARYSTEQRAVLALRPGITDAAALAFLDEEAALARHADPVEAYVRDVMPVKIRMDLEFAARETVWRDVAMLAGTARMLWRRARRSSAADRGGATPSAKAPVSAADRPAAAAATPRRRVLRWIALLRHRRQLIVACYAMLVPLGYATAFLLRFDFSPPPEAMGAFARTVLLLAAVRLVTYWYADVFRGYWQHFGLYDLLNLGRAVTIGSIVFTVALLVLPGMPRLGDVPRGVIALEWTLAIFLAAAVHGLARLGREVALGGGTRATGRRTLVIGAGECAERVIRQLRRDQRAGIRVVGLLDDDPEKVGQLLHGARVLGGTERLAEIASIHRAALLVIAIPSATQEERRRLVNRCIATGVEFRVVRPLDEVIAGGRPSEPLRHVEVEDLLGRPPVRLDVGAVSRHIAGRTVLVTGGAGSIGSELARQAARLQPRRVVLFDHAESALYFTHLDLQREHPEVDVVAVTGCVTNEAHVERAFRKFAPDVVLHAAAYKHVPMMEENVLSAVHANVRGTLVVARRAAASRVREFVLLSTDKAVYPSSVMGATKRIAERIILGWPGLTAGGTEFRAVRFGNVLGSEGSVIPLFRRQLQRGGPLTVTHPDVTRYFMTVQEAVQLVLQTLALDETAGRIAMLEMGESVRIVELAENLVRLSGREPYAEIPIIFTGMRPGEKLSEDLVSALESGVRTSAEQIRVVATMEPSGEQLTHGVAALLDALDAGDEAAALDHVRLLVPECVAPLRHRSAHTSAPVRLPADAEVALPGSPAADIRPPRAAVDAPAYPPVASPPHEIYTLEVGRLGGPVVSEAEHA